VLGRPLYVRDTTTAWLPLAESFVHCAGEGSLPLWDPYTAFGRPLLADPRAAVLYPLTWLNLVLLPAQYYALFAIAHVALGIAGVAALARALGLSRTAAAGAAGVFGAGGPFLSLVAMWSHLAGAAYLPWIVWAFVRVAERPTVRRVTAAAALLALSLFGGSPEMTALAALATALVLLDRLWTDGVPFLRSSSAALAGAAVLGLGLAAAQWLPTLRVVERSLRWNYERSDALVWSLHPATLPEAVVPARWNEWSLTEAGSRQVADRREPFLRSIYLGAGAALLAAVALCRLRRDLAGPLAMVLIGGLLALGRHTPFYEAVVGSLPLVSGFRYPVKAFVLLGLGWSLLAGVGLDRLRTAGRRERVVAGAVALALAAALGAVALAVHGLVPLPGFLRALVQKLHPPAGAPLLIAGCVLACAGLLALRVRPVPVAFALLACLDLTYRHWQLNPSADPHVWRYRPPAVSALDRAAFARTYVVDHTVDGERQASVPSAPYRLGKLPPGLSAPVATMLAVQETLLPPLGARWRVFGSFDKDIAGFDPSALANLQSRFLRASPDEQRALLRVAGVRNLVGVRPGPLADGASAAADLPGLFAEPIRVARLEGARPRAYLVDGVRVGDGADALLDPAFVPEREVIVPAGTPRASQGEAGSAGVTRMGCNTVEVSVDAAVPARLVLIDAYDEGWSAAVDGSPAPVTRANVGFRSVEVPAGRHAVAWTYVPPGFRTGLAVTLAAGVLALALLLRGAAAGRASPAATSR
jgi:hypothetical protein